MLKTQGEMVLVGCGGAGVSIVNNLQGPLKELGDGFSKISAEYIDSSLSNIKDVDHDEDNFHLIRSNCLTKDILGSGGLRRENAADIVESIKEFVDKKQLTKPTLSTYYIVISSASGGTGSVAAPLLVKNLLDRGLPTAVVLVGDSSNGQWTKNTLDTLATYNSISKGCKKPLSIIYNDNMKSVGNTTDERSNFTDKEIFKNLSALSLFLSGENTSIDQKDMVRFFDPTEIDFDVKPGLYGTGVFVKDVNLPDHITPIGARTITTPDISCDINLTGLTHYKAGTTDNNNVISMFKGQFPIHIVSYANSFSIIEHELKEEIETIRAAAERATVDDISTDYKPDENGLVF